MGLDDLAPAALAAALGDRPVRTYPALLSTEADALAWARSGAPAGALVVADYQASPRGRGGLPWRVRQGEGLGFSLVARPALPPGAEGWLYVAATAALADVAGPDAAIEWPDEVHRAGERFAAVGCQATLGPSGVEWAVLSFLLERASPPRAPLLARTVAAVEAQLGAERDAVRAAYRPRCATFGRQVRARLVPLGPASPAVEGTARDVLADGALVLEGADGRRRGVRPQDLGALEDAT